VLVLLVLGRVLILATPSLTDLRRKGEEGRDGQCAEIRGAGVAYLGHGAHGS